VFKKVGSSTDRISDIVDLLEIVVGDQERADEVVAALKDVEVVVHLIHSTVPSSSMRNPTFDVTSNVVSTAAWLSRLSETCVKRVIYISSGGTVYGVPRSLPVAEDHPLNPMSAYGISKLACEKFASMYSELNGIEYRILRPANAYGEGQPINRGQGILGVMADRIARNEPIEVWGTGTGLRDYVHVDDVVGAILASIEHCGTSRIFNVSTGIGYSVLSLIDAFQSRIGCKLAVEHLPARGFDVPDNVLDNALLRRETSWCPRVSVQEGIDRLLAIHRTVKGQKVHVSQVCA
jgi:UDP-glucose 4-epimerase